MSKKNESVEAGIKWAAEFLKGNPEASFAELSSAKPSGVKVWKGLMGSVRSYMETGKLQAPQRKLKEVKAKATKPSPQPQVSIIERLEALERGVATLYAENSAAAARITDLADQLGLTV